MSAAAGDGPARWNLRALSEALVMGGITFAAYALWDRAMQRGRLLLVVAVSYFTPLLSSLVSSLYLGVVPGIRLWAGCLLLVAGSVLSWWSTRPAERG
jgi:drug/metabolite transporter (DMT)-like permease